MKRIVSVLLVCVMLVPMFAVYSSAAYENTHVNTGNQIEDIIGVAMTQVGYKEGNSSSQLSGTVAGSGNFTKYGKWYGINPGAWCAMFVSWCANQAGISTSVIPKHASCDVGMAWFKITDAGSTAELSAAAIPPSAEISSISVTIPITLTTQHTLLS